MKYILGIDIGSAYTKSVIIDENKNIICKAKIKTLPDFEKTANIILEKILQDSKLEREEISYIASTGLGRYTVPFRDIQITDITSSARGSYLMYNDAECVLDIGAQLSRAIKLSTLDNNRGKVACFRTNDKCAAGSGAFIEKACKYLEVNIEDAGLLSLKSQSGQSISSICAVLAESEIINHISAGVKVEDILRGIHKSLASRAIALLKRAGFDPSKEQKLVLAGGVALQLGFVKAIEEEIKAKPIVPENPEYIAAFGAAALGLSRLLKLQTITYFV